MQSYGNTIFAFIAFGISVLIIGGNFLTILAIKRSHKLNTASNQFILGLAIADLLVGFGTPYYALSRFIDFGKDTSYLTFGLKCLLSRVPLLASCIASIGHLSAISIDRYMSVARPLQHKAYLTPTRSWKFITFIWVMSTLVATVPMYHNRREQWNEKNDMNCMIQAVTKEYYYFFLAPLFGIFFITMVITHAGIYRIAHSKSENARKPLKMVAIIVGCFIVCWTPFMVLLQCILDQDPKYWNLFLYSFIPATLNSFINPVIYAWKMKDFRTEFAKMLGCCCCAKSRRNSVSVEDSRTSGAVEMRTIEI